MIPAHLPRLRFKPQPDTELAARVKDALPDVYDVEVVLRDLMNAPGTKPRHVFDFGDGLRMIISRDQIGKIGIPTLHVSMSIQEGYPVFQEALASGVLNPSTIMKEHLDRLGVSLWPPDDKAQTKCAFHAVFYGIDENLQRIL